MGFVQLDSINVVARAHHLTLAARRDGYRKEHLKILLERRRRLFEHWVTEGSLASADAPAAPPQEAPAEN